MIFVGGGKLPPPPGRVSFVRRWKFFKFPPLSRSWGGNRPGSLPILGVQVSATGPLPLSLSPFPSPFFLSLSLSLSLSLLSLSVSLSISFSLCCLSLFLSFQGNWRGSGDLTVRELTGNPSFYHIQQLRQIRSCLDTIYAVILAMLLFHLSSTIAILCITIFLLLL